MSSPASFPPASRDPISSLGTHWRLIAGTMAAGMLLAWIFAAMQPKRYRASAVAAVAPLSEALSSTDLLRGVEVLEGRTVVATVAALAGTPATRQQVFQDQTGSSDTTIAAVVLPNTNLVRVDVEAGDPARAAEVANRVVSRLSAQTRAMYRLYGVTPVSPASSPSEPISPRVARTIMAGLLIGLAFGAAAAMAIEKFRRTPGPHG